MKACSRLWSTIAVLVLISLTIAILLSGSAVAGLPSEAMAAGSGSSEWKYTVYGSGIGGSEISVFDIDGDNVLEMIMAADSGASSFSGLDFWYVVRSTGGDDYEMVWSSDLYSAAIGHIAVADVNADGIGEIFVGLINGDVYQYDGLSMGQTGSFTAGGSILALVVADSDGDGEQEIVTSDGSGIYIYSALSLAFEWASPVYGGKNLAVGNVDADSSPEIVASFNLNNIHGYVLDGVSHVLEWDKAGSLGVLVELGDLDSDGMAEIIGPAGWGKINVYDADTKSLKWEIPVFQDVIALLLADTDGAGAPEILYSSSQWGAIICYDTATQTERWVISAQEYHLTDIAIGDVNNDGVQEVLWGNAHLRIADTLTHSIEWTSLDITGPLTAVDAGDVDDDGQAEIIMVSHGTNGDSHDGAIHIFDATTHDLEWRSNDLPGIISRLDKSVKIGDVDDDGQTEFVIATDSVDNGLIQIYDGQTHTLERQSPTYSDASFTALAIGDVDNDANTEIVIGQAREYPSSTRLNLIVFDGATAIEEWKSSLDSTVGEVYNIKLADVDNDSHVEILASVANKEIYAYDGVTRQLDWFEAIPAYALDVADLDGDIQKEILVGKFDGVVDEYDGITHVLENSSPLGNGEILGLLIDDVNLDGNDEWVVSESTRLSIFKGATKLLVWQNKNMGGLLGNYNHLVSMDVDDDLKKELVLGSNFALYQLDITLADHCMVFMPLVEYNICYLFDDFSDPSSGWPVSYDGQFRYEYRDGEYRIDVGPLNSWAAARPGVKYSDYTVEVDVRNPNFQVYGTYGLVFGLSDNWQQFYTLEVDRYGYWYLWRYNAGNWTLLDYRYVPGLVHTGTSTNHLRVVRTGARIIAYANDNLLVDTTDTIITGPSHAGLIVTSYDEDYVSARFDNFLIYPPGCTPSVQSAAGITSLNNFTLSRSSNFDAMTSGENGSKTPKPFELLPQPTER